MHDLFDHLERLRASSGAAAMATLISARGLGSRRPGSKMWIGPDGAVTGAVTLGGCVELRVAESGVAVLEGAPPRLVRIDLTEEDAWDLGLTCAGALEVFIEAVRCDRADDPVLAAYDRARRFLEAGGRAGIAWRLDGLPGRMVIGDDGTAEGSLNDEAAESAMADRAPVLLARGRSGRLDTGAAEPEAAAPGASGPDVPVFVEVLTRPPTLVVFGGGPVAAPLLRFARELGLRTVLVEPRVRPGMTVPFDLADEVRREGAGDVAASLVPDRDTAVVLIAHDYKIDLPVLRNVLRRDIGYVGVLGSRRRGDALLAHLADEGVPEEALARVHMPVGLDIGAESPAEVALSTLAEIVATRAGRPRGVSAGP